MVVLKEPLYAFSIPPNVVVSLRARETPRLPHMDVPATSEQPEPPRDTQTGSLACALCLGALFTDVNDQRNHFRSDWHRYNAKMRIRDPSGISLTEIQFASLVEGELVIDPDPIFPPTLSIRFRRVFIRFCFLLVIR
jgi:ankyrin repeat and zinc finger domain-containing protein 1